MVEHSLNGTPHSHSSRLLRSQRRTQIIFLAATPDVIAKLDSASAGPSTLEYRRSWIMVTVGNMKSSKVHRALVS